MVSQSPIVSDLIVDCLPTTPEPAHAHQTLDELWATTETAVRARVRSQADRVDFAARLTGLAAALSCVTATVGSKPFLSFNFTIMLRMPFTFVSIGVFVCVCVACLFLVFAACFLSVLDSRLIISRTRLFNCTAYFCTAAPKAKGAKPAAAAAAAAVVAAPAAAAVPAAAAAATAPRPAKAARQPREASAPAAAAEKVDISRTLLPAIQAGAGALARYLRCVLRWTRGIHRNESLRNMCSAYFIFDRNNQTNINMSNIV